MQLTGLDWAIIAGYFAVALGVGIAASRKGAAGGARGFFLAGGQMPFWLLGISMVATTFSTDTPNLVTDLVRRDGVSGNWGWWAFLLTGMLTVFVYARMWRRSGVLTDIEFYELRYSGPAAAFLRGFRAIYLGLVFNVLVMGTVSLAAIKLGGILLGWPGWQTLLVTGVITLAYSAIGGLRAVILTDFIQFILAMVGSVWACTYLLGLDGVGGLSGLLEHPDVMPKLSMLPDLSNPEAWVPVLLVPLAVQWWASYYPGAEPGGGGYIAQRMFSARDESHAVGATLLFNVAHYALRPWPWILIALASLIVFPDLDSIRSAFPAVPGDKVGHDLAYPAMLSLLPSGLLGLVAASLLAAFMSTMSTQVNLGASYLVNDFYVRFVKPDATDRQQVTAARIATVVSLILGSGLGLLLTDAGQAFQLLLLIGAGTGGLFILRWFWLRISAWTEIVAMVGSLVVAGYFTFVHDALAAEPVALMPAMAGHMKLVVGAALTTAIWVVATFVMPAEKAETLERFVAQVKPESGAALRRGLASMLLGTVAVYAALFATGNWIYGQVAWATGLTVLALLSAILLFAVQTRSQ
jgi:Na+/proline symporter